MRITALRRAVHTFTDHARSPRQRTIHSLALSVYFRHPDFGMKDFEILSRASAFLLAVDPPEPVEEPESMYSHLDQAQKERAARKLKEDYTMEPAGGPPRFVEDLGWLEFCPQKFRPVVHCVAASHVLSPWAWKNYYPQDWLSQVGPEHCVYSLEVYDQESPNEALAKFGLSPSPIHDPSGRDLAIIHLKHEETALQHMKDLGVQVHYLRKDNSVFEKGEEVVFDGFNISEDSIAAQENIELKGKEPKEDTRVFFPYSETGILLAGSPDRFVATTPSPLPEGVCGGPVLDKEGKVCGIVEGIVPPTHENKEMAGAASFIPSPLIGEFIDHAEHHMLEQIVPEKLFSKIESMKSGKGYEPDQPEMNEEGREDRKEEEGVTMAYNDLVENMKKSATIEEAEAVLHTVRRERDEVIDILKREGGDADEIIKRVRQKTLDEKEKLLQEVSKEDNIQEAEVLSRNVKEK